MKSERKNLKTATAGWIIWPVVRGYQLIVSPILHLLAGPGYGCRYRITCSEFFLRAVQKYGLTRGVFLTTIRLSNCQSLFGKTVHRSR